jgi:hypothetical protein
MTGSTLAGHRATHVLGRRLTACLSWRRIPDAEIRPVQIEDLLHRRAIPVREVRGSPGGILFPKFPDARDAKPPERTARSLLMQWKRISAGRSPRLWLGRRAVCPAVPSGVTTGRARCHLTIHGDVVDPTLRTRTRRGVSRVSPIIARFIPLSFIPPAPTRTLARPGLRISRRCRTTRETPSSRPPRAFHVPRPCLRSAMGRPS